MQIDSFHFSTNTDHFSMANFEAMRRDVQVIKRADFSIQLSVPNSISPQPLHTSPVLSFVVIVSSSRAYLPLPVMFTGIYSIRMLDFYICLAVDFGRENGCFCFYSSVLPLLMAMSTT